uniref:Homing endonuclease LAGLIDADG domain-containing protein n=1 Tax=Blastosporella zonata TaxID=530045 RepID=A0A386TY11_9AGAR|nr:hypothetical protein C0991_000019 [Blastosporella zonata]AYE93082.1 hypothetical protein C0991_000019 [Blastosporella zonata]
MWPIIILLIVNIIYVCAICWKDILFFASGKEIVKIYNKTILVRGLFIIKIFSKYIIIKINPVIVKYYYKISNQPITKIIIKNLGGKFNYFLCKTYLLLVGISETIRAKKNDISILCLLRTVTRRIDKHLFTTKSTIFPAIFRDTFSLIANFPFFPLKPYHSRTDPISFSPLIKTFAAFAPPAPFGAFASFAPFEAFAALAAYARYAAYARLAALARYAAYARYVAYARLAAYARIAGGELFGSYVGVERERSSVGCSLAREGLNKNPKICDNHNNEISLEFKQWFAGLTDGVGYIFVNKEGTVGFELTLNSMDEKVLRIIQNKFGGNIHARAGLKAIRYRSPNKNTVYKIIQCLNGLVINNIRLAQLHKACLAFNIPIKDPIFPDIHSAYISGLLDADGYINIYKSFYKDTYRYQLTIAISNKSLCNIDFLSKVIGGKIYFDKKLNGHYKWVANSKLLHLKLYDYFLKFPPKTVKRHKTFLIKNFHDLNDIKAYLETEKLSVRYKIWQDFAVRWDNKN